MVKMKKDDLIKQMTEYIKENGLGSGIRQDGFNFVHFEFPRKYFFRLILTDISEPIAVITDFVEVTWADFDDGELAFELGENEWFSNLLGNVAELEITPLEARRWENG